MDSDFKAAFRGRIAEHLSFWVGILMIAITLARHLISGFPIEKLIVPIVSGLICLYVWRREKQKKSNEFFRYFVLFSMTMAIINGGLVNGGIRAPVVGMSMILPLFPISMFGRKGFWVGLILAITPILTIVILQSLSIVDPYRGENELIFKPLIYIGGALITLATIWSYERARIESEEVLLATSRDSANSFRAKALWQLAGGLAHEVNNPLTVIRGRVTIIQKGLQKEELDKQKILEDLEKLNQASHRISNIMDAMKAFSANPDFEDDSEFTLVNLYEKLSALNKTRAASKNIDFKLEGDLNIKLKTKRGHVLQILNHLIANSTEAVEKLEEKWIRLSAEKDANFITISITDSGLGIPVHIQERMLDPFFSTKAQAKGTGLGLSIAHGIAQSINSKLLYEAQSKNTTFKLKIPTNS